MKNCLTCKWEPDEWEKETSDASMIEYRRLPIPYYREQESPGETMI